MVESDSSGEDEEAKQPASSLGGEGLGLICAVVNELDEKERMTLSVSRQSSKCALLFHAEYGVEIILFLFVLIPGLKTVVRLCDYSSERRPFIYSKEAVFELDVCGTVYRMKSRFTK